jgi:hypothetical protein
MTGHSRPLQLVNFDIEKAFDWVEHHIILQVLRAFGLPEIMIMTLQHYAAVGFTFCKVNDRKEFSSPSRQAVDKETLCQSSCCSSLPQNL